MKKFLGGVVLGFASGVAATVGWAFKEWMRRPDGRERVAKILRLVSSKIDKTADKIDGCEMGDEDFDLFDIGGTEALFSDVRGELERAALRTSIEKIGKELYTYWLRDDGGGDRPLTLEKCPVRVNYFGTVVTKEPIVFPKGKDLIYIQDEDWGLLGGKKTLPEFLAD